MATEHSPLKGKEATDMSSTFLTGPQVLARYQISAMTLHRWQNSNKLGFPKPMIINRRKFFKEAELIQWERAKVAAA